MLPANTWPIAPRPSGSCRTYLLPSDSAMLSLCSRSCPAASRQVIVRQAIRPGGNLDGGNPAVVNQRPAQCHARSEDGGGQPRAEHAAVGWCWPAPGPARTWFWPAREPARAARTSRPPRPRPSSRWPLSLIRRYHAASSVPSGVSVSSSASSTTIAASGTPASAAVSRVHRGRVAGGEVQEHRVQPVRQRRTARGNQHHRRARPGQ